MSELTIRSGSIVEVDTESLRTVAAAMQGVVAEVGDALARLTGVVELVAEGQPATFAALLDATVLRSVLERAHHEGGDIARAVGAAATLYDAVELCVARDAAAAIGDTAATAALDARLARLQLDDPSAVAAARDALDAAPTGHGDLYRQAFGGASQLGAFGAGLMFPAFYGVVDALRLGAIPAGARLAPGADTAVRVSATATGATAAPASLAAAAGRIPSGDAQVRVERYTMADGSRQFAVYVAGTRSGGAAEPFDNRSNVALYTGSRSASYEAVTTALREAGADDHDVVHAFGHSQGAMVLERLAAEGGYDTRTLVSFGSPVQAEVADTTLSVSVRHTDDPVAALQSGGHAAAVGAPQSFVVERLADPTPGLRDVALPAHGMAAYTETAAMIDASSDPRAGAVGEVFASLGAAESVEATDYVAERVSRGAPAGAG